MRLAPACGTAIAMAALLLAPLASAALDGRPTRLPDGPGRAPAAEPSSNMGFKVETAFPARPDRPNEYLVALPYFNGTGDVADAAATPPCSEAGAPRTDGLVDALDLLCDFWTSRQGGMTASRWVQSTQSWQHRAIWRDAVTGEIVSSGDWLDSVATGEAFVLRVSGAVTNLATIVGSHDPVGACALAVDAPPGMPAFNLLNHVYHRMYLTADEALCGLEGSAWTDADGDGQPDRCDGGMFDPAAGGSATVLQLDDPRAGSGLPVTRTVMADPSGPHGLRFIGPNFTLAFPDASTIVLSPEQPAMTWCEPHY